MDKAAIKKKLQKIIDSHKTAINTHQLAINEATDLIHDLDPVFTKSTPSGRRKSVLTAQQRSQLLKDLDKTAYKK